MSLMLSGEPKTILVVDDEVFVRNMIARWLMSVGYRVRLANSANDAWECLATTPIDLVTLDIAMPGESGLSLLGRIKARYPEMPVIMLTASGHAQTAIDAMNAGASSYLVKPIQQEELLLQVLRGLEWRQMWLDRQAYTQSLEIRVREQTKVIREAHEETIHRLVAATMCRDEETGEHIIRTGLFSEVVARAAGWSCEEAERLRFAAPMHDIGKIGIPDAILQKAGRLTPEEFEIMKTHTTIGASILDNSKAPVLQLAREIALGHHERWDGTGYPFGVKGEEIPVAARILSIVDVYDALTHDRVYRPAFPEEVALRMMQANRGTQFDPELLAVFFTVLEEIHELAQANPDHSAGRVVSPVSMGSSPVLTSVQVPV
jgi:putative two-component system response regulator